MASIVRRGNSWSVVVDLPREDGKRKQKWFTFHTVSEAEAFRIAWNSTKSETVAGAAAAWLERKALSGLSDSTMESYAGRLSYLLKYAGDVNLAAVVANHVEGALAVVGPRNRLNVYRIIRMFLTDVRGNAPQVTVRQPKQQRSVWTATQAKTFLENVDEYELLFRLALMTGLRKGELLALYWEDFDGEGLQVYSPKTGRSRYVVLDASTAVNMMAQAGKGRIFTMHPHTPNKVLSRLTARMGLPPIRFHDLRHTHATLALGMGADLATVSRRLGHSSVTVTAGVYQHATTEHDRALAQALGERLAPVGDGSLDGGEDTEDDDEDKNGGADAPSSLSQES